MRMAGCLCSNTGMLVCFSKAVYPVTYIAQLRATRQAFAQTGKVIVKKGCRMYMKTAAGKVMYRVGVNTSFMA